MRATDLIKSLSLSSGITSEDFKVVTLYKGQNPDVFLIDNFGDGRVTSQTNLKPLTILESQDFLAIYGDLPLATPDDKSTFVPDCTYYVADENNGYYVSLYSFN